MKSEILSVRTILSNPDSPFCYFGWPSVTRLPGGELAAVASGYRLRHVCPFGKAVISYSFNEGKTWTRPAAVIDTPLDDRDSGILSFGSRVIFTSFNNTLAIQHTWAEGIDGSTPAGEAEKRLRHAYLDFVSARADAEKYLGSTYCFSEDGGYTFGPVHISPVTSPHGPAVCPDGSLIWVGRRFSSDDTFDSGAAPFIVCCKLNARDEFEPVGAIDNIPRGDGKVYESCEPHAVVLPDGKIIVHIRVQGGCFTVYQSESTDGGKTFTRPRRLLDEHGGSPAHLMLLTDGRLVSVYGYRNAPFGVRFMVSDDYGASWQTDLSLYGDGLSGDLGYPASVLLNDGSICTVFYENIGKESVIRQIIWRLT